MVNVIVLFDLESAKSRLSPYFNTSERKNLVLFMFSHVLNIVEDYPVIILTKKSANASKNFDQSGNINSGIISLRESVDDDILILPSDLPLLEKDELLNLMGDLKSISIAPSQRGGTSALFLPRGIDFIPRFGKNSLEKHIEEANSRGLKMSVYRSEAFMDVDVIEDIEWILSNKPDVDFSKYLSSTSNLSFHDHGLK